MASYFKTSKKTIPLYPKAWLSGYPSSRFFNVEKEGNSGYNVLATYSEYTNKGDESCGVTATKNNVTYYFVKLRQQLTIRYQWKQIQNDETSHSYYFGYIGYQLRIPETATMAIYSYWWTNYTTSFGGGGYQPSASCWVPIGGFFSTSGDTNYHSLSIGYNNASWPLVPWNSNGSSKTLTTRLYRNPSYKNDSYRAQYNSHYEFGKLKYANWNGSWGSGYYSRNAHCTEWAGFDRNCVITGCYNRDGRGDYWRSENYGGSGASCAVERESLTFTSSPISYINISYSPTYFFRKTYHYEYRKETPPGTTEPKNVKYEWYTIDYNNGSDGNYGTITYTYNL